MRENLTEGCVQKKCYKVFANLFLLEFKFSVIHVTHSRAHIAYFLWSALKGTLCMIPETKFPYPFSLIINPNLTSLIPHPSQYHDFQNHTSSHIPNYPKYHINPNLTSSLIQNPLWSHILPDPIIKGLVFTLNSSLLSSTLYSSLCILHLLDQ